MSLTPSRIAVIAALMTLVAAAPAAAQDEPQTHEATFEVGKPAFDEQYAHVTVPFRCDLAAPGQTACDVTISATYRRTRGYPKFQPTGPEITAGSARATVPQGAKQDVELVTSKIIEDIAKTDGGSVMVTLTVKVAGAGWEPKIGAYGVFQEGCRRSDPYTVP